MLRKFMLLSAAAFAISSFNTSGVLAEDSCMTCKEDCWATGVKCSQSCKDPECRFNCVFAMTDCLGDCEKTYGEKNCTTQNR